MRGRGPKRRGGHITLIGMPTKQVRAGDDFLPIFLQGLSAAGEELRDHDIICVASKVLSISENRIVDLCAVRVTTLAQQLAAKGGKSPAVMQVILDVTQPSNPNDVVVRGNHVSATIPNGLILTSGGVDRIDAGHVVMLPADPDRSARRLRMGLSERLGVKVGVVVTDSDGRRDKKGSTQVAVGVADIDPLRTTKPSGSDRVVQETLCDMLAATAGLLMGQHTTGCPVVIVRGLPHAPCNDATLDTALHPRITSC